VAAVGCRDCRSGLAQYSVGRGLMALEAGMTRSSLNLGQRQTVEIIEALGFGVIERLSICDGLPSYQTEPRITQTIKLASQPERQSDRRNADLSLNKAFENLFDHTLVQNRFLESERRVPSYN
jgi:hypothetical protein